MQSQRYVSLHIYLLIYHIYATIYYCFLSFGRCSDYEISPSLSRLFCLLHVSSLGLSDVQNTKYSAPGPLTLTPLRQLQVPDLPVSTSLRWKFRSFRYRASISTSHRTQTKRNIIKQQARWTSSLSSEELSKLNLSPLLPNLSSRPS
jgi:hypothetical protein